MIYKTFMNYAKFIVMEKQPGQMTELFITFYHVWLGWDVGPLHIFPMMVSLPPYIENDHKQQTMMHR